MAFSSLGGSGGERVDFIDGGNSTKFIYTQKILAGLSDTIYSATDIIDGGLSSSFWTVEE